MSSSAPLESAIDPPDGLAARLAHDFGSHSALARRAIHAFYRAVEAASCRGAAAASALCGNATPSADCFQKLAARCGIASDGLRAEAMLAALQTWHLLLVKMLTAEAIVAIGGTAAFAAGLCRAADEGRLRHEIEAFEAGRLMRQIHPDGLSDRDPFSWYLVAWSKEIEQVLHGLADRLARYPRELLAGIPARGQDLFERLYQQLLPRAVRHALGEYYTPDWLAAHVLDSVSYRAEDGGRLLDPACGSGIFLLAAIRRLRAAYRGDELRRRILDGVTGLELHPLAAATGRANYLLAIADLLCGDATLEIPIHQCDSILDGFSVAEGAGGAIAALGPACLSRPFDFVVGNPPWIAWDHLPTAYREATKPLWQRYGLFSLSGNQARHGGGKKDLSMLMLYRSADRYLKPGGRLGMVITQTVFQSKGAGDGFRRFRLGVAGEPLRVLRVDDLAALKPFSGAANWTATIVLEKGSPTTYPVPYVQWGPGRDGPEQATCWARPVEPEQPGSPWLVFARGDCPNFRVDENGTVPLDAGADSSVTTFGTALPEEAIVGRSDYTAHLGANSGGANAVYWLELVGRDGPRVVVRNLAAQGKRGVAAVVDSIEPDLLHPLLRWGDVGRWRAQSKAYLLLAQDPRTRSGIEEARMRREFPHTYRYLRQFEACLRRRAAYRRYQADKPFYSMYNVGVYTVAPIKVVWRRMDRQIRAAVVEAIDDWLLGRRTPVPQETCVLIACESSDEAHYVCAMLNSAAVGQLVAAHSVRGGKGFGTPGILEVIGLRRFDPLDARHAALAALSRRAHELVPDVPQTGELAGLAAIERDVDRLAAER